MTARTAPGQEDAIPIISPQDTPARLVAGGFGFFANLLLLTGPLYMLQIHDRVIPSGSGATLVALSLIAGFLFLCMGILDHARARIFARIGLRLQERLDPPVMAAAVACLARAPGDLRAQAAPRDLDLILRYWASPLPMALRDLPWSAGFIALLFVFHPWLGAFGLAAGLLLVGVTLATRRACEVPLQRAAQTAMEADLAAEALRSDSTAFQAAGMAENARLRWQAMRSAARRAATVAGDRAGGWNATTRVLRLALQSAILGLGAWAVLEGSLDPGAMIAATIILARALQPVEVAIGQWQLLVTARAAQTRLAGFLHAEPPPPRPMPLPRPAARLEVRDLVVIPPGAIRPVLGGISFSLGPGQALGVIGPSGAGKSALARAMAGIWAPASGEIRLGGATLAQYCEAGLSSLIGHLPQQPRLARGTIAENIARLAIQPEPAAVIRAATRAGAHEMILRQSEGYDTRIDPGAPTLSGGQIQRICLARALYGDPVLLILDEPDSSLDAEGTEALSRAMRAARMAGTAVIVMAHRPAAIRECDQLLVLSEGRQTALGPRDTILREALRNAGDVARGLAAGASP